MLKSPEPSAGDGEVGGGGGWRGGFGAEAPVRGEGGAGEDGGIDLHGVGVAVAEDVAVGDDGGGVAVEENGEEVEVGEAADGGALVAVEVGGRSADGGGGGGGCGRMGVDGVGREGNAVLGVGAGGKAEVEGVDDLVGGGVDEADLAGVAESGRGGEGEDEVGVGIDAGGVVGGELLGGGEGRGDGEEEERGEKAGRDHGAGVLRGWFRPDENKAAGVMAMGGFGLEGVGLVGEDLFTAGLGDEVGGAGERGDVIGLGPEKDAAIFGPKEAEGELGFKDGRRIGEEGAVPEIGGAAVEDVDGLDGAEGGVLRIAESGGGALQVFGLRGSAASLRMAERGG